MMIHRLSLCCLTILALCWCLAALPASAVDLRYTLARDVRVSLNIYDAQGHVVRELLHAAPRTAGPQLDIWDGCDRLGNPLPAGAYTWKLLGTQGLQAEFLLQLGNNYPNGPGAKQVAPGSHGGPYTMVGDETGIYMAAVGHENIENYLVKLSPDGSRRLWSAFHREVWEGGVAMARDGETLYVLSSLGSIYLYRASDGKDTGTVTVGFTGMARPKDQWGEPWNAFMADRKTAQDLDVANNVAAVAYPDKNTVRLYEMPSGKRLAEFTVPAPHGVAMAPTGEVYVSTGTRIVRLSAAQPEPITVIDGLLAPGRLDIEHADGTLLVFDAGAVQQVKRYAPDGKLLASYGRAGGRVHGLYTREMQESFLNLSDVTADGHGGLFIAEPHTAPRRVAHLDAQGKLLGEWYGGQKWAPVVMVDPDNSAIVYMGSHWGTMMRLQVDYEKRTWHVHSTYVTEGLGGGLVGNDIQGDQWQIYKHEGVTYFGKQRNGGRPLVLRLDEKTWQLKAAVFFDERDVWERSDHPKIIRNLLKPGEVAHGFLWTDTDGDGLPQREEVRFSPGGYPGNITSEYIDSDFAIIRIVQTGTDTYKVFRRPVSAWNACGSPVYAIGQQAEQVLGTVPARFKPGGAWNSFPYHNPKTGDTYAGFNNESEGWGGSADSFLVKWDKAGQECWQVGRTRGNKKMYGASTPMVFSPGDIGAFRVFVGETHGCAVLSDYAGGWDLPTSAPTYVWDGDGLWVGGVLDQPKRVDERTPYWLYQTGGESIEQKLYTDPNTGEVLYFSNWENEQRVYRISGWDGWQRATGTVQLPAAAQSGLRAEYYADDTWSKRLTTRLDAGVDFQWGNKAPAGTGISNARQYAVRWSGVLIPAVSGPHKFGVRACGGVRLVINGRTLIDAWTPSNTVDIYQGRLPLTLKAGERYEVQLEYTRGAAAGSVQLCWVEPEGMMTVIPTTQFRPSNPYAARPLGHGTGLYGLSGEVEARESGLYAFQLNTGVNDTELWVNGELFSKVGKGTMKNMLALQAGQRVPIRIVTSGSSEQVSITWATPKGTEGAALHQIPECQLYPPNFHTAEDTYRVPVHPQDADVRDQQEKGLDGRGDAVTDMGASEGAAGRVWDQHAHVMPFLLPVLAPGEILTAATLQLHFLSGSTPVAVHGLPRISAQPHVKSSDYDATMDGAAPVVLAASLVTKNTAPGAVSMSDEALLRFVQEQYAQGGAGKYIFLRLTPTERIEAPFTAAKFATANHPNPALAPALSLTVAPTPRK